MASVPLTMFDWRLPKDDDCWHLDEPHEVTITRLTPAEPVEAQPALACYELADSVSQQRFEGPHTPKAEDDLAVDSYIRVGINARAAWKESMGEGIRVVVLDNGVDFQHPSLLENVDLNDARDFDHDFDNGGRSYKDGGRIDNRFNAHGTACAGIVAAAQREGVRVVGVAPKATLVPIRISTNFQFKSLIAAIAHAETVGDVILLPRHLPWAGADPCAAAAGTSSESRPWQDYKAMDSKDLSDALADRDDAQLSAILHMAIRDVAKRVPIVCASGNDGLGSVIYPACLAETIAVGACNEKGYRSTYSQYGKGLDLVAPSSDLATEDADVVRLDLDEANFRVREEEERLARVKAQPLPPSRARDLRELKELPQTKDWNLERFGELSIATTDNTGDFGYNDEPPGDFCPATGDFGFGGTSAAAAQVAGVVALMLGACLKQCGDREALSRYLRRDDHSMAETVSQLLKETTSKDCLHPERGRTLEAEFGAGLVNATAAVNAALETLGKRSDSR